MVMNIISISKIGMITVMDFPGDSVIDNHLFVNGIILVSFPSTEAFIYKIFR